MSVRGAEGSGSEAGERRAGSGRRVRFEALVAVGEAAGGGFEAESMDVSPDGMRLRAAHLPEVGERLVCHFDGVGAEIAAEGEVTWRNEEAKGGEFGLRFVGLDAAATEAVRAMCAGLKAPPREEAASEPTVPRGSRVRLHIDGLGSPMKARVRDSASCELQVGSNLEFLKVGRSLELEDVEHGGKREATIDDVKVDVDPATHVPQLVVTLRWAGEKAAVEKATRASTAPVTRRASPPPPSESAPAEAKRASSAKIERDEEAAEAGDTAAQLGERAVNAGRAVANTVAPALAGVSSYAKGAMAGVVDLIQKRRTERAESKKAAAPRRTTAPPPGGALTSDGRRLVRDDSHADEEEIAVPVRSPRRAAAVGGALGLLAVLSIFGAARLMGRGHTAAAAPSDARTAVAALPAPSEAPGVAPGTPTANVPLFGATPLSTTEPAPGAAPAASASAAPSAPASADSGDGDDDPAPSAGGTLKEWGQGTVQHPVVLKIKMDGAIEKITGAAGAMGFTISVPGRRSVSPPSNLAHKDKRLASVNVVNTSHGAEVTVQFKDGVPAYVAKAKGDRLEIAIGKEGHSKIAKSKSKKKKH